MKELAKISRFGTGLLLVGLLGISSCKQQNPPPEDIRHDATVIAVEKVMPSVVNLVAATRPSPLEVMISRLNNKTDEPDERAGSVGSGVIIDEAGYVLTSLHVVQVQSLSRVVVKLSDGREFDCDGVANIPESDIALLKLRAPPTEKFQPIKLAQDDDLLLGETVIAIGNPLKLTGSVTKGILSSRNRRLPMSGGPVFYRDLLQTDAAINAGNSGGPLVNLLGEMIGLNEAVLTNQQNIGFAIPVKQIRIAISKFFAPEVINQIWFGAQVNGGSGSLRFIDVWPDSPASQSGLHAGDEVIAVNGKPVESPIQFHRALCGSVTNRNIEAKLVVRRNGENYNATVQLIAFDNIFRSRLGITLLSRPGGQLVVETVEPDSPAAVAGVRPGLLLPGVDNQRVDILTAFHTVRLKKKGETMLLNLALPESTGTSATVSVVVR